MRRLFQTSTGPVMIYVAPDEVGVEAVRFAEDGSVAAYAADEWDNADLEDLLASEGGIPDDEAHAIAEAVVREWVTTGGIPPAEPINAGTFAAGAIVVGVVGTFLAGLWTIFRALFGRL